MISSDYSKHQPASAEPISSPSPAQAGAMGAHKVVSLRVSEVWISSDSDEPRRKRTHESASPSELPTCKKIALTSQLNPVSPLDWGDSLTAKNFNVAMEKLLNLIPAKGDNSLGEGGYGRVEKWVCQETGMAYAVKIIKPKSHHKKWNPNKGEITALLGNNHPNRVNTLAVILKQSDNGQYCLINDLDQLPDDVYPPFQISALVCEYVDGLDLDNARYGDKAFGIKPLPGFVSSPRLAVEMGSGAAAAVADLHDRGLIYRDLKPDNLMVERNSRQPKLIDYSFAKKLPADKTTSTFCGTRGYQAPEVVRCEKALKLNASLYDYKADAWSLGMLLINLSSGFNLFQLRFPGIHSHPPLSTLPRTETLGKMTDTERRAFLADQIPALASHPELLDIIVALTRHNVRQRMSVQEAAQKLAELKSKLLIPSPTVSCEPGPSAGKSPAKCPAK